MKVEGKRVLITGGSRGIGFATARALVRKGAKIVITGLERALKDHGIRTVITVGTQVQTAVLHTATEAALRGYKVIAWHLTNTLLIKQQVTLTRVDLVSY
jgi:NAD(P)-dependent dehydrogenase (short-subunit alcohol dehydrogenase family)